MLLKILVPCIIINFVQAISNHPVLILVSYDAFRHDFLNLTSMPFMSKLRSKGAYVDYLYDVFPTKTFPVHFTIATGLYPESHGVVSNVFYDPKIKKKITISESIYEMFHYREDIVPIWRLNEDEGPDRHSGVMMWPGGCIPYQNKNTTYCRKFEANYNFTKRVDEVLNWIEDPKKPANLIMLYIEQPDSDAHIYGIQNSNITEILRELDFIAEYLDKQLQKRKIAEKVTVIHLSDHGIIDVTPPKFINVSKFLIPETYDFYGGSPSLHVIPRKGHENDVYERLLNGSKNNYFKVLTKAQIPKKWHYKANPRIPPLLLIADFGYAFEDMNVNVKYYQQKYKINVTNSSTFGVHGYDSDLHPEMRPFFMARGPHIKTNHKVTPFNIVDVYGLLCKLLNISAQANNGTMSNIMDIIEEKGTNSVMTIVVIAVAGIVVALLCIGCITLITLIIIKRQQNITSTAALNKRFPQTFQSNIEAQHLLEPEET